MKPQIDGHGADAFKPIIGLRNIGAAFNKSGKTISRWEKQYGFPLARLPGGECAATPVMMHEWLVSRVSQDGGQP